MAEEIVNIREYLEQFRIEWTERMGGMGDALAKDLRMLVDLLLTEEREILVEVVESRVAPWAIADNSEQIPLEKISKEGIEKLLQNREYISDGELFEILKLRYAYDSTGP